MALRPARLLPPKRLLTPRSARRLSATNRGLLPGSPAITRTGLAPAGLVQFSGRNMARHPGCRVLADQARQGALAPFRPTLSLLSRPGGRIFGWPICLLWPGCCANSRTGTRKVNYAATVNQNTPLLRPGADPSFAAYVREVWSFFWPALERHFRDGPLKPTGESSPPSLLPLKVLGSRLLRPGRRVNGPGDGIGDPRDYPSIKHQEHVVRVVFAFPSRHNS